jgi:hypothetical protein
VTSSDLARSARGPGRRSVYAATVIAWILLAIAATGEDWPASAAARPVSDCTSRSGATVVVDFGRWGGPLLRACGSTPTTGYSLLNQGGWHTTGTEHDGPAFICRIGYAGYHHGTQYPTPAQQPCVSTPPASAYWAYWEAGPGQNTWSYSQAGAPTYHPQPGSISLWIFGGTNIGGTAGSAVPAMTPASLRRAAHALGTVQAGSPAIVNAQPVGGRPRHNPGSYLSVLASIAIAAALTTAGILASRRRRRKQGAIR